MACTETKLTAVHAVATFDPWFAGIVLQCDLQAPALCYQGLGDDLLGALQLSSPM